jgi:two-component system sensor histidine kinase KdpD
LLERALANVIANAVRAAGEGPVRVEAGSVGDDIHLRVVDRGRGIDRRDRERIFQPFQRLGDHSSEGVGLGLAVARGFVEAMRGELTVEDTPGGGATMVISLPAAP